MKICIVSDQHLSANPRVWKEAGFLSSKGFDVVIVTMLNSQENKDKDLDILKDLGNKVEYKAGLNIIQEECSALKLLYYKIRQKIARQIKRLGIESKYLINIAPDSIYSKALDEQADIYLAHVECGFYVGKKLRQKGNVVLFDFEDWYSKDYLVPSRPVSLLSTLEKYALQKSSASYCTSKAMAKALCETYDCNRAPEVIYNSFPIEKFNTSKKKSDKPSLVWFSQTIGKGRGLESIISVLENVSIPVSVVLIGNCNEGYKQELKSAFPFGKGHDLEIKQPVRHNDLHTLLSKYDIGLALEETYPESRNKTITNKILQYLQAGLKVLATDTDGQKEVADEMGDSIELIPNKDISIWSAQLEKLIERDVDRESIQDKYNEIFSFEAQQSKLLNLIERCLG